MMDLDAIHRAAYASLCRQFSELHLQPIETRGEIRQMLLDKFAIIAKEQSEERDALRKKNRAVREREKAERALHAKSRMIPEFWIEHPNHDGRRDTMEAVLKSLGMPAEATELMPLYAKWFLTAPRRNKNGPMNRWALMNMFVKTMQ
jgi:hypothetical protein